MGKLVRKNVILDADELARLARCRGKSESAVLRELVHEALGFERMAEGWADAFEMLRESGGVDDVFGRLAPSEEERWLAKDVSPTPAP